MGKQVVSAKLSGDVINLLAKRGITPAAIAKATGTTKLFISRVKSQSRGLTLDHLRALEGAVGEPLPFLLLKATPIESVRPELRPLYLSTLRVVSGGKPMKRAAKRRAKAA